MAFKADVYAFGFNSNVTNSTFSQGVQPQGSYVAMYLAIPTMTVGYSTASTPLWIQGSDDGVTYRRLTNPELTNNTLVAGINDFQIASSVSQRFVTVPYPGVPYLRLEVSGTCTNPTGQTSTNAFKIVCIPNQ